MGTAPTESDLNNPCLHPSKNCKSPSDPPLSSLNIPFPPTFVLFWKFFKSPMLEGACPELVLQGLIGN